MSVDIYLLRDLISGQNLLKLCYLWNNSNSFVYLIQQNIEKNYTFSIFYIENNSQGSYCICRLCSFYFDIRTKDIENNMNIYKGLLFSCEAFSQLIP